MKSKNMHELARDTLLLGCRRFISHFNLRVVLMSKQKLQLPFFVSATCCQGHEALICTFQSKLSNSKLFPNDLSLSVYSKNALSPNQPQALKG